MSGFDSTLHGAALRGDLKAIERILRAEPSMPDRLLPVAFYGDPDEPGSPLYELSALHCAVLWNQPEAASLLIRSGAGVNVASGPRRGVTALHIAASRFDRELAGLLLAAGAAVEAGDGIVGTPLHFAVSDGEPFSLEMDGGSCFSIVEMPCGRGEERERAAMVTYLVEAGAKRDDLLRHARGSACRVLLELDAAAPGAAPRDSFVCAVEQGHIDLVGRFLAKGVERDTLSEAQQHALTRLELLRLLLQHAPASSEALVGAVIGGSTEAAALLVRSGADPAPAFAESVQRGDLKMMKLCLDAGVDSNRPGPDGSTPLHVAARWDSVAGVELLLRHGAAVNARDAAGQTPLHSAIVGRHVQHALILVAHGADPHLRRNSPFGQETAIELAAEQGLPELAELLGPPPA